jgi:hypothetical protein
MNRPLHSLCLAAALLCAAGTARGQCANNNTPIAGGAITPNCPGTTSVPCVQGGQYALINVVAGNQYTFATCGASFDTQLTLYNNSGGGSLGYNDDSGTCGFLSAQSFIAWTATFTGQLRVLVDRYNCASNTVCAPLTITCTTPPPPVTNGSPCGALPLSLVSTCGGGVFTNAAGGNSGTSPAPTCGSYVAGSQDVWFTFTAGPLGAVNLQSWAGGMTDGVMAVYSAPSCSGPFTQIGCNDDATGLMPALNLTGLTPGQTYYVRFWGYGTQTGSFTLCAQGVASFPPGDCVYILSLFDSYGDGWGTSNVGISINGAPYQYYTVGTSFNQALFGVNIGDVVTLIYNNSGSWQGENSYTLTMGGGGMLYNSGSPPPAGLVYAGVVDCVPPPAPPEDCIGAITICSGQSFNNNTNNTGQVADLTLVTAGCLLNTERQGTWYTFSPSTSGTIAFTINPSNPADDYDFAIWGPYPPGSNTGTICPPSSPPLRCSYAAPPGATGLNFTATDLSESAVGDKWVRFINALEGEVYILYISNWSQSGLSFSLDWNPQMTASLDCTLLPLGLLDLRAEPAGTAVQVSWATASALAGGLFTVERAGDDGHFAALGSVPVASTPGTTLYHYRDEAPLTGLNLYRLLLREPGEPDSYSRTVHVRMGAHAWTLSPNPVEPYTLLLPPAAAPDVVVLHLFNAQGRSVGSQRLALSPAGAPLPVEHLPAGLYHADITDLEGRSWGRVRLVKP